MPSIVRLCWYCHGHPASVPGGRCWNCIPSRHARYHPGPGYTLEGRRVGLRLPATGPTRDPRRPSTYEERIHGRSNGDAGCCPGGARDLCKPDVDKMARAGLDALTGVLFADDSQVVSLHVQKEYAGEAQAPGAVFVVRFGEQS